MQNTKIFIWGSALAMLTLFGCGRQEGDAPADDPITEPPHMTGTDPWTEPAAAEPAAAQAPSHAFTAQLSGSTGPTEGDPEGSGSAQVTIDEATGELCYELTVENIEPATMAHIHVGGPDETGGVVVPFAAPTDGSADGCLTPPADAVAAIIENPEGHYVNVHNEPYPGGAVRGQLTSQ
jgi:hypothetical protein